MSMEKQTVIGARLKESYSVYTHSSGLKVLLYPMKEFSTAYALFGTKYGSIDTMFRKEGEAEFTVVPEGIAHYLEHKLFESEDGDAFSLFARAGASANAFTSFDKTCYLFSTTQNFEAALSALLQFVQNPYFTKENVEKEQGIIAQEIKMYEDNPSWRVYFNLLRGMYHNHPVHTEIAGTVESIARIDAELLYRCYHTFYNLNNMVISIAGNFDEQTAVEIIEKELKDCEKVVIERSMPHEPDEVVKSVVKQKMAVAMPLFYFAWKEKPVEEVKMPRVSMLYDIILDVVAGDCSPLYRRLYDEGLIDTGFDTESFMGRGYAACIFGGYSKDPEKVASLIAEEIKRYKEEGIDAESFERARKSIYGAVVGGFDSAEEIASTMLAAYFCGCSDAYVELEAISDLTVEDANRLLAEGFDEKNTVLSVIEPM